MASRRWILFLAAAIMMAAGCGSDGTASDGSSGRWRRYEGQTFTFDYPFGWHIWDSTFMNSKELVIIANVAEEMIGHDGIPEGTIKIDISSTDLLQTKIDPPSQNAQSLSFPPSNVKYHLYESDEPRWTIEGNTNEANRLYIVSVLMQTAQPATNTVEPILSSFRPVTR
jgi:hypothetical protein